MSDADVIEHEIEVLKSDLKDSEEALIQAEDDKDSIDEKILDLEFLIKEAKEQLAGLEDQLDG